MHGMSRMLRWSGGSPIGGGRRAACRISVGERKMTKEERERTEILRMALHRPILDLNDAGRKI
jgi:hypothetical protein